MRGTLFNELSAFVAVAEHCSFTKAAASLGLSLPTISQTIRSLEERLEVRLLNRTTRSVSLTEAGERLLTHMQPLLEGIETAIDAVNDFRNKPAGQLRLTVARPPALALVAPLLPLFLARYPAIELEVSIEDSRINIVSERFDAGIRVERRIEKDMIRKRFYSEFDIIAVASPTYLQKAGMPRAPKDLLAHNCVRERGIFDPGISAWEFQKQREKVKVDVTGSLIVNDMQMSLSAVLDGVGIGYYPAPLIAPYLKEERLVQVMKGWTWKSPGLFLYYSSRRQMPTPLKVFISFIDENKELIGNLTPTPALS